MKRASLCLAVVICLLTTVFMLRGSVPVVGTGQWTTAADMSDTRDSAASVLLANGDTLIVGGSNSAGPLQTVDVYHSDGTLTAAASMQVARSRHTATLLQDGRVLVAGGDTGAGAATNSAEIYDPSSGSWTPAGTLNSARFGHSAILLDDGTVAIIGGESNGSAVSTIEIYDRAGNSFSQGPSLNVSRKNAAAAKLADGRVLVAGGFGTDANGNSVALKSAEIFDPNAGTVTAAANMNAARGNHSATAVLDGLVVVAGGSDGQADLSSIEIYSPASDTWNLSPASLSVPRSGHAATLLPDNNSVLISGGASNGIAVQAADIYQPWTDGVISGGTMNAVRANGAGSPFGLEGLYLEAGGSGQKSTELYRFPTIKTDKPDYAPGTPVLMTGTGYQPGETVNLNLKQDDGDPDTTTSVQADTNGNISYQGFAPDTGDVGTHFHLTAMGQKSGYQAQTIFTDGNATVSGTVRSSAAGNPTLSGVTITCDTTSGCNALSTTTTDASGNYSFKPSFAGSSSATITLTASKAGFTSATQTLNVTTNGQVFTNINFTLTPSIQPTTTSVASSANPSVFGQSVTFTATVTSGGNPVTNAGGETITFKDGGTTIGTGTLNGSGVATFSTAALAVATHSITAVYGGDANFTGSTSAALSQVVNKANTNTTVTSSVNPSVFGQSVTFTATVSASAPGAGTPTGTVTFLDGASTIGTGTLSGGIATFTTSALSVGNHTITTSYGGDANFNPSTGSLTGNPQVVNKASVTTTVTSSLNPSTFGQSVTFTATVSPVAPGAGTPTGTVTFLDGASTIGTGTLIGGVATFSTSSLTTGNHTITTNYGGDGNFNGSTGSLTGNPQVVNKANTTTTVASSVNPSVFGQSVTFTATVLPVAPGAGTPAGTVTFLDGGHSIGTGTLSGGIATFTTSALFVGNHTITTSSGGDANFNTSTGSLTGNPQVVNKASVTTTVTSSLNPSTFGQSVTFTATVSPVAPGAGTPTGTVTFLDGGSPIGTGSLSGGVASFSTSALSVGGHSITATYNSDANFNGSTGSLTGNPQVVNKASTTTTVTSSVNPSVFGQSVTFTATVSPVAPGAGTPSGTVTFLDGGSPIGTGSLSGGVASFSTSALSVGGHSITATYNSDANFNGSTSGTLAQNVNKANSATTVTSSVNPSAFGQSVTLSATISPVAPGAGTVTGSVTFLDGATPLGSGTITAGVATFTTSALSVGNHTITTSYGGDGNFNGSSGSLTGNPQVVNKADTFTSVTSSLNPSVFGQSVTFTATVVAVAPGTGTPIGVVTFLDGGSPIGTGVLNGGVATFTTSSLSAGNHTITTNYSGDPNFNGSTGALTGNPQVVNKADTTTAVTSSLNPSAFGQAVTFTATVSAVAPGVGTPPGIVTFFDGGNPIGSGTLNGGVAAFTTSALAAGSHTITSNYGGDGNFNGSIGSLTGNPQVVDKANTATSLASSAASVTLGDTVTFTATVVDATGNSTGTPTGLVTFLDGSTPLGSGTLTVVGGNDQASFSTSLLAVGSHTITVVYDSDADFNPSTSNSVSESVQRRNSSTAVALNPSTVVVGQPSTATVTVTDSGAVPPGAADTFVATGAPATGRTGFTSTLFAGGLVLVAGGTDQGGTVLLSAEVYSVSGAAFTATGNLQVARTGASAVLLPNGKVLIAGGSSDGTANGALDSAELFDPASGTFVLTSQAMKAHRVGATATLLATGKVLIAGGANAGGVLASAELYDPATDSFADTGSLSAARTGAAAVLLGNGKVLIAGGSSDGTANGALSSAELFDPAGNGGAGLFGASGSSLSVSRWQPMAAALPGGKVLVTGGANSGGALTSADLYDPSGDSFAASAQQMSVARSNGSAVSLPSGMVLLVGGASGSQTAELYDQDSDKFDTTGSLQQPDNGAVATLLNNGQVLVVGLTNTAQSDAALYSPSFNPLGTVNVTSSDNTDSITSACVLTPSNGTDSTCTSTVTPADVNTSPRNITGSYPADAIHSGSSGTASLTVNKADTTTTVTSSVNPSVFGQSVTFTATVSPVAPGAGTPSGTVTFLDGGSPIGTGTLSGGIATFTTSALAVGNHTVTSSYGGDANFNGSTGSLTGNPQVVNKADTTTTVASSVNPSVFGQSVTFTATVSPVAPGAGTPTGNVTFLDGGSAIGTGTLSGGVATFSTSALSTGNHTITTSYGGDGDFNGSTGSLTGNPQVVNKANTTTTVASSVNPSVFGQSITFTATVSPVAPGAGTPSGTVTFLEGGSAIGTGALSGGIATFTTSALAVGNHTITTSYGGDGNFNGSTGSLTGNPQVVNKADTTTTVATSVNPSVFGQSVTFTATVSPVAPGAGTPTGTVTFLDGGSAIGTGTLSGGVATFSTSALSTGNHTITTSYGGDGNFNGSTGSLTGNPQVVNKADSTTTVASSVNPSVFGQSVTFTATVSPVAPGAGTPTGNVTFLDGGSPIGTGTLSGGVATTSTSGLNVGNHNITASYGGDGNFNGSTGSLTGNPQVVNKADTTTTVATSVNPSVFGQSVTFTATVSLVAPGAGTPTGNVTFLDGGSPIGTGTLSGGVATTSTSGLNVGNHNITASYGGDGSFNGSTGSLAQTVNKANTTTAIASSVNPSVFGQSVTFTATVTPVAPGAGTPTGTVTFLDGGSPIGTGSLSGGVTSFSTSALSVGGHSITTTYNSDANFNGSASGTLAQNVNKANSATTVTSSVNPSAFGQSVTLSATIAPVAPGAGTATGSVTFLDGATPIGSGTITAGVATFTTSALSVGNHTITTSYGGDGNFNGSTGSLTGNPQVVNKANTITAITSVNPESSVLGASYTVKWTVTPAFTGTPTGSVTVNDGSGNMCSAAVGTGQCVIPTSTSAGSKTLTASYGGDGNFNPSSGTQAHQVIFASGGTCDGDLGHSILQPINPGTPGNSVFKQGSTVPAKFRVCDANGNSIGTAGVVAGFVLYQINSGVLTTVNELTADDSTNDLGWRFDPTAQQWIYNMNTKAAPINKPNQTYFFRIDLSDGTSIFFNYGLK